MQKEKNELQNTLKLHQDFPQFLKQMRKGENISLDQLSEGLITASQLARIEKGQRPISKNMRDRVLGRLGVASDLYENLLNIEDYTAWEQERNILCAVDEKEIQKAQELIAAYEKQRSEPGRDKIKQQFCLVMQAEILKQQNADQQEIGVCYEKAVKLTVPDIENLHIKGKLLCIQEVNMVLEYELYHKGEDFAKKCKELMEYIENSVYDDLSKVKIYPKIAYYYLQEVFDIQGGQCAVDFNESLEIYNRAVGMLRDTGRAYFLIELLDMKTKMAEYTKFKLSYQENMELAVLLKQLYNEYEVPAYMLNCTYLYRQRWMFYVGDVLRIRRQMYGLTQKALCEGICSVRTLRRAEKREVNMQNEVLGALLRKLGLSQEIQKARLVTNDREVIKLREEMAAYRNNHDMEKAREILAQIKKRVSVEIPENRQYFMELEASLDWMEGKIAKKEYAAREEAALRCTLNVKNLRCTSELYLTEMELLCIRNKIQGLEGAEKREHIDFLIRFFECYEKRGALADCISMYEFVAAYAASELGNIGEYQASTDLDKKVLREDLRCRRVWVIANILYNILWNECQYLGDKAKKTECLKKCILLSHFCKQTFNEQFYRNKLDQE